MPIVKQADSLFIDYEVPLYGAIDSTWGNWGGTYEISVSDTSIPIISGSLTRSAREGIFELRLKSDNATWTAISAGTYKLITQFSNSTVGYREERTDKLIVKTQGLT